MSENLGESKLAERFGVKQYPVIFVDDVLIARPQDFGFFGGEKGGRYSPWIDAKSHEKFKLDLTRMINLVLSGKKEELKAERAGTAAGDENIAALPAFDLVDLAGNKLTPEQARGRVVLVEFWATWCPPCRSTLGWLGDLRRKYGDNLAVLALAVASPEDEVRKTAQSLSPDLHWAIASPETAQAFGDLTATPTLFLFDRQGKTAGVFYGAPPDLHAKVEKTLNSLIR